ncbi:MAG: diguanylate cyclase [Acidobacteriia bacterium]|nr:diguanylate cyclase [Terriglobia bacterium]
MRVLIAEDDPVSRHFLGAALAKMGHETVATRDGTEAWARLQEPSAPRLAILDWMMPRMDGPQVCKKVRQRSELPYTYIILLTTKDQKQDIVEGLGAGADDYLTKPFDRQELEARLRAGERILNLEQSLRVQAIHDALTGLLNRGAIMDFLTRELARADRDGNSIGLIMADIDHFKHINDTCGHPTGDAVLREVAARLRDSLRGYDGIGRFGGEEFLMVVPGCGGHEVADLAERIRARIGGEPVPTDRGPVAVTLSLGAVASESLGQVDAEMLITAADQALYRAKNRGRNCVDLAPAGIKSPS